MFVIETMSKHEIYNGQKPVLFPESFDMYNIDIKHALGILEQLCHLPSITYLILLNVKRHKHT